MNLPLGEARGKKLKAKLWAEGGSGPMPTYTIDYAAKFIASLTIARFWLAS